MSNYSIYAILPWVKLGHETTIDMGPVKFYRASEFREYLKSDLHESFEAYINKVYANVYARVSSGSEVKDICIRSTSLNEMTLIILDEVALAFLSQLQKDELIFDAIHLLCFASNLGKLNDEYGALINDLKLFLRIGRIDEKILKDNHNWGSMMWFKHPGRSAEILSLNSRILDCFGKILPTKFLTKNARWTRRIIRSVQNYNRIFIGEDHGSIVYYGNLPEHIISLSTAFESLLDVHLASTERRDTLEKFKNALLCIFNIKYAAPQKILNKWCDEFYNLRSRIVHGDDIPDQIFHGNENIDIAYINLGMKIFTAALTGELCSHTCIEANLGFIEFDNVEQFYTYLWPQISLLAIIKELLLDLRSLVKTGEDILNKVLELSDLERIYLSVYCDKSPGDNHVKLSDKQKISVIASQIIRITEQKVHYKGKEMPLIEISIVKDLSKTDEIISQLQLQMK